MTAYVKKVEDEHHAHIEHEKHEAGGELPEQPEYAWLNKRNKPFPWGMNSLFFNPEVSVRALLSPLKAYTPLPGKQEPGQHGLNRTGQLC